MDVIKIGFTLQDGREVTVHFCRVCGKGFGGFENDAGKSLAEKCCTCSYCNKPIDPADRRMRHKECEDKYQAELEAERIAKAEKLETWDGWVYYGRAQDHNEGYFEDIGQLVEYLEEEEIPIEKWPEFVFICKKIPYKGINLDSLLEQSIDDMYEDAMDDLRGVDELQAAINRFNEINNDLCSYGFVFSKVVRVPRLSRE
jgi:hypothetical protein